MSGSVSSSGRDAVLGNTIIKNFTDEHKATIQRVQRMRKDLADWRDRADVQTRNYTDQLKDLQDELLLSIEELREDITKMSSKVRGALDKHDPAWREMKNNERR